MLSSRKVFFFFFLLLLGQECFAKKNEKVSDWFQDNLQGKVKNIKTIEYAVVFQNGKIQKGEIITTSLKAYNKEGYIIESIDLDADNSIIQKEIFLFDKKGNKIEELLYNEENEMEQRTKIRYNPLKLPIQSVSEDNKGRKIQRLVYRYDDQGYLIQLIGYDNRGKMSEKSYYSYDQRGNLIQYLGFGQFDNRTINYKYNDSNRIIELLCMDIKGNFIEKFFFQYGEQKGSEKRISVNINNKILHTDNYLYDEYNNLLELTHLDINGLIKEQHAFVYQYDTKGNWTSQIFYTGVEKLGTSITERIIEYYD